MRILGAAALSLYARRKPHVRRHIVTFRALLAAASWRRPKDVEAHFGHVATFDPPDRVTFTFTDEDLCIEIRVNFALGLVLIVKPLSGQERHEMTNEPIRPIRTEADYQAALAQIGELLNAETGTPESDRLEILSVLVADYERKRNVDVQADPVDVLMMSMKAQGRTQADLAALLESRSRASEVLSRRRQLSTSMIEKIEQAWSIPSALLQAPIRVETRLRRAFTLGVILLAITIGGSAIATWAVFSFYGTGLPDTGQIAATFAGSRVKIPDFTPLDEISPDTVKAFLAAEDDQFYSHGAYSVSATIRAAIHLLSSGKQEGAATITQQLVKNAFLNEKPSISRKIKEVILARRIEQALTKDRILEAISTVFTSAANKTASPLLPVTILANILAISLSRKLHLSPAWSERRMFTVWMNWRIWIARKSAAMGYCSAWPPAVGSRSLTPGSHRPNRLSRSSETETDRADLNSLLPLQVRIGFFHPGWRIRLAFVRHALRLRPAVNPRKAAASRVIFRQRVGRIGERLAQRDKGVPAALKHREQVRQQIGVHLAGMDQQNVRNLVTGYLHCALFEECDDGFHIWDVLSPDTLAKLRMCIQGGKLVVGIVDRYGSDAIAVLIEEGLQSILRLGCCARAQIGMAEELQLFASRRECGPRDRFALQNVGSICLQRKVVDIGV